MAFTWTQLGNSNSNTAVHYPQFGEVFLSPVLVTSILIPEVKWNFVFTVKQTGHLDLLSWTAYHLGKLCISWISNHVFFPPWVSPADLPWWLVGRSRCRTPAARTGHTPRTHCGTSLAGSSTSWLEDLSLILLVWPKTLKTSEHNIINYIFESIGQIVLLAPLKKLLIIIPGKYVVIIIVLHFTRSKDNLV